MNIVLSFIKAVAILKEGGYNTEWRYAGQANEDRGERVYERWLIWI